MEAILHGLARGDKHSHIKLNSDTDLIGPPKSLITSACGHILLLRKQEYILKKHMVYDRN